uniref:Uncharacterized protein n=1 Tax=viral metagenome TaxID=1070528 RepID=A0A6M3K4A6_9ZZZZ
MAIELDLTVDDKGSETVARAANNMTQSLGRMSAMTSSLSSGFSRISSRVGSIVSNMFTWQKVMTGIGSLVGAGYLAKQAIDLGLNAENAGMLRERTDELSTSWRGFLGKIGEYVAASPEVRQGLKDMSNLVGDWGKALTNNKDVIDDWVKFARESVKSVGDMITSAINAIADFSRNAPIGKMSEAQVSKQLGDMLGGKYDWSQYMTGGTPTTSAQNWAQQYPSNSVTNNVIINEKVSRSDAQAIIREMERSAYRDTPNYDELENMP